MRNGQINPENPVPGILWPCPLWNPETEMGWALMTSALMSPGRKTWKWGHSPANEKQLIPCSCRPWWQTTPHLCSSSVSTQWGLCWSELLLSSLSIFIFPMDQAQLLPLCVQKSPVKLTGGVIQRNTIDQEFSELSAKPLDSLSMKTAWAWSCSIHESNWCG